MTLAPDTSPQLVEGKLRRAWRKGRRFHHAQGLAHFLMWLVAMVPVDLLIDFQKKYESHAFGSGANFEVRKANCGDERKPSLSLRPPSASGVETGAIIVACLLEATVAEFVRIRAIRGSLGTSARSLTTSATRVACSFWVWTR